MSEVICSSCFEIEDTTARFIELPYVCSACERNAALAMDTYNSGIPCQSALDSAQADAYDIQDAHNADVLDQFDADTELINGLMAEIEDLKMQLSQANLNIQVQGEIIDDLENTVNAYRVIFRIPGY